MIDIGANLTSKRFRPDLDQVIERARAAGVAQMVVTGLSVPVSWAARELASRHRGVLFSTAGIHPHNARTCNRTTPDELRQLGARPEVVAIGECGLDYDRNFSPPAVQRRWFAAQLAIAAELSMPVFLHERKAHDDFVEILREHRAALPGGVVHCFTGGAWELDAYLELDLHIGITGWICDDRRGRHLRQLVGRIPKSRLMIETDAPFLIPRTIDPMPADRRNEPSLLPYVRDEVARCLGADPGDFAARTASVARRFFGLPTPEAQLGYTG